eukprot:s5831_g2.t3
MLTCGNGSISRRFAIAGKSFFPSGSGLCRHVAMEAWELRTKNCLSLEDELVFMRFHFHFFQDVAATQALAAGAAPQLSVGSASGGGRKRRGSGTSRVSSGAVSTESLVAAMVPKATKTGLESLLGEEGVDLTFPELGRKTSQRRKVERKKMETVDDMDVKSQRRLVDKSLFLLVRYGAASKWTFPKADRLHGQSMRETLLALAEHQLGHDFTPYLVGACPFTYRKRKSAQYPGIQGRKIFYYRARLVPGSELVLPGETPVKDWAWYSRKELEEHLDEGEWTPPAITGDDCPECILVNVPGRRVQEAFKVKRKTLGKGGFSTVKRLINRRTGAVCVMKEIKKKAIADIQLLQEEVKLQASMDHPHIARLFETFEDSQHIDIVMELCEGGDVLHLIEKSGCLPESQAGDVFRQLMCALSYMHQRCHVAHRDIKPENLVLKERETAGERVTIKLIDFGFARKLEDGGRLKTICGTPLYVAPEVFSGSYSEKCDIWSSGVTLHYMLLGRPPFDGEDVDVIWRNARKGLQLSETTTTELGNLVPPGAIQLIRRMCEVSDGLRPSAHEILSQSWWLRGEQVGTEFRSEATETSDEIATNLRKYCVMNPLKKAALNTIVHVIDDSDLQRPRETFESLDTRCEGSIPLDTLRKAISESALGKDADRICSSLDTSGFQEMDYSNWLSANVKPQQYLKQGYIWEAFRILDKDSSGKISAPELQQVLARASPHLDETECEHLLAQFDKNGDGEMDFEEFQDMLRRCSDCASLPPCLGSKQKSWAKHHSNSRALRRRRAMAAEASADDVPGLPDSDKVYLGAVKSYNDRRGFGFVACAETAAEFGRDVYMAKLEAMFGMKSGRPMGSLSQTVCELTGGHSSFSELNEADSAAQSTALLLQEELLQYCHESLSSFDVLKPVHRELLPISVRQISAEGTPVFHSGEVLDLLYVVPGSVDLSELLQALDLRLQGEAKGLRAAVGDGLLQAPGLEFTMRGIPVKFLLTHAADVASISAESINKNVSGYVARQTALAILESVPDKRAFQQLLTCVRFWAKQRGVYGQSHDFGYLGGAGWAICCALVCQIEQHQDLEQLLGAFFDIMSRWDCRVPVALNGRAHRQVQRNSAGLKVLLPVGRKLCANPNLTASAALQLQKEFRRGNRIFAKIQHSQADWKQIFSVSKFFERYFHYLQFDITASSEEIMFQWLSWCRQHLQGTAEMLETVGNCHLITRPWPVWLPFKDCEWNSAIAVFIALRVLPHTRNEQAGTRTVVDLREILVTLLERLCAWPLATEHFGEFDLYIRHTSQAEVKSWLTALEGGFPVKRARPTTQTQAAIALPEPDSEDDLSRQSSSFEFQ